MWCAYTYTCASVLIYMYIYIHIMPRVCVYVSQPNMFFSASVRFASIFSGGLGAIYFHMVKALHCEGPGDGFFLRTETHTLKGSFFQASVLCLTPFWWKMFFGLFVESFVWLVFWSVISFDQMSSCPDVFTSCTWGSSGGQCERALEDSEFSLDVTRFEKRHHETFLRQTWSKNGSISQDSYMSVLKHYV